MNRTNLLRPGLALLLACTLTGSGAALFAGDGHDGKTTDAVTEGGGPDAAHLWAVNCQQCHNLRPATTYSDTQLQIIVHHMRTRAHITGAEQRAIVAFLKEAN